jgi:hypothetical protein
MRRKGGTGRALDRNRILGLEGRQRAQRAPELGLHCAAVAQQRIERSWPMTIPDQGEAKTSWLAQRVEAEMPVEQFDLHPIRPMHAPGRHNDPSDEDVLQDALGRQLGA